MTTSPPLSAECDQCGYSQVVFDDRADGLNAVVEKGLPAFGSGGDTRWLAPDGRPYGLRLRVGYTDGIEECICEDSGIRPEIVDSLVCDLFDVIEFIAIHKGGESSIAVFETA